MSETLDRLFAEQRRRAEAKMAGVWSRTTCVLVCALPDDVDDIPDWSAWSLRVEWRGGETWAVCHFGQALGIRKGRTKATNWPGGYGVWDWEPSPSYRSDAWVARFRFTSMSEALRAAQYWAPRVVVNGLTPADVIERARARAAAKTETGSHHD